MNCHSFLPCLSISKRFPIFHETFTGKHAQAQVLGKTTESLYSGDLCAEASRGAQVEEEYLRNTKASDRTGID